MASTPTPLPPNDPIGVAEFTALRAEIMQRSSFQQQLINLSVIFAGGLLTTYFHFSGPTYLLLSYPILTLFMALEWSFNNRRIHQIGTYIKDNIEKLPRWEQHLKKLEVSTSWLSGAVLAYGAFAALPFLIVILALFTRFCWAELEIGFLAIDALVLIFGACTINSSQRDG